MFDYGKGDLGDREKRNHKPENREEGQANSTCLTLWLTGARKEAKPTEARPVEPSVRPDRVRCRA